MEIDHKALDTILKNVADNCDIREWDYVIQQLDSEVVNYVGNIIAVSLIDKNNGNILRIMIKRAPQIPYFKDVTVGCYERETFVYTTLIPLFKELKTNIDLKRLFPECFYADSNPDNALLVLENMTEKGFERYSKGKYLDLEHLYVSLKTVAEFHALSFVMTNRNVEVPNKNTLRPFLDNDPEYYCNTLGLLLRKYTPLLVDTPYKEFFNEINANLAKNINDSVFKARGKVFSHGDFWKENILFNYNCIMPSEACILDFQMTRVLSPAYDVLFLIMTGAESPLRRHNFPKLLSCYFKTLQQTLEKEGLDPEKVYSEKDFTHDLRLVFPLCFSVAFFSFILWSGLEDIESLYSLNKKKLPQRNMEEIESATVRIIIDLIEDFIYLGFVDM